MGALVNAYVPTPDPVLVRTHFRMLHELAAVAEINGMMVLCTYGENPTTGAKLRSRVMCFAIGDFLDMTEAAVSLCQEPHRNVYAPWAIVRPDIDRGKRGSLKDIRGVLALVVDQDADRGKAGITQLPLAAPYVVRSSGDNLQPTFPLARAVTVARRSRSPRRSPPQSAATGAQRTSTTSGASQVA